MAPTRRRRCQSCGIGFANSAAVVTTCSIRWTIDKVTTGKRNRNGDHEYLLDTLGEGAVSDMAVNLLDMSFSIYMTADAAMDASTDEENE